MYKIELQHFCVNRIVEAVQHTDAANVRCKHELSFYKSIIQRFLADSVPYQCKAPCFFVEQCNRKHSLALPDGLLHAVCLERLEQYFRVRCSPEGSDLFLGKEPVPELPVIVNLPIEDAHVSSGQGMHRLRAVFRQINNREPAVPEHDIRILTRPNTPGIRSPVVHPLVHFFDIFFPVCRSVTKSGYPTHTFLPIPFPSYNVKS